MFFAIISALCLVVVLITAPDVSADCTINDSGGRFVVVCSSKESSGKAASDGHKKAAAVVVSAEKPVPKEYAGKAGKVGNVRTKFEPVVAMSDEEKRIMALQNNMGGSNSKTKSGEKRGRKSKTDTST